MPARIRPLTRSDLAGPSEPARASQRSTTTVVPSICFVLRVRPERWNPFQAQLYCLISLLPLSVKVDREQFPRQTGSRQQRDKETRRPSWLLCSFVFLSPCLVVSLVIFLSPCLLVSLSGCLRSPMF